MYRLRRRGGEVRLVIKDPANAFMELSDIGAYESAVVVDDCGARTIHGAVRAISREPLQIEPRHGVACGRRGAMATNFRHP